MTVAEWPAALSPYQKHEGAAFIRTLKDLSLLYYDFLNRTYPDCTFEMANILSSYGSLNIPVDVYKRAGKATASSKTADIVSQYGALDSSKKLLCIRIGYAWMFPKEEDVTPRTFTTGIKYFLAAPRGKLTSGLKAPPACPSTSWTLPPVGLREAKCSCSS
jgi:hypothetical protein